MASVKFEKAHEQCMEWLEWDMHPGVADEPRWGVTLGMIDAMAQEKKGRGILEKLEIRYKSHFRLKDMSRDQAYGLYYETRWKPLGLSRLEKKIGTVAWLPILEMGLGCGTRMIQRVVNSFWKVEDGLLPVNGVADNDFRQRLESVCQNRSGDFFERIMFARWQTRSAEWEKEKGFRKQEMIRDWTSQREHVEKFMDGDERRGGGYFDDGWW